MERSLRSAIVTCLLGLTLVLPTVADDRDDCLYCHRFPGLSRYDAQADRVHLYSINPSYYHDALGAHARLSCTDCHVGHEVQVIPHKDVTPVDCARTCHLTNLSGLERRFSHENVATLLEQSVHTHEILRDLEHSENPLIGADQSTCLLCHDEPVFRDPFELLQFRGGALAERTFDRCDVCHSAQLPTDVQYYFRHVAARLAPARSTLEIAQNCATCHSDARSMHASNLPNTVTSYLRSFHGKAALLGDEDTADCLSCHVRTGENVHRMLASDDPRSSVHPDNVADSCRSTECHPGAGINLATSASHLDLSVTRGTLEFALAVAFILLTVVSFGPSMVIVVLELWRVMTRGRHGDADHERLVDRVRAHPLGPRRLVRFTVSQRIEHWLLAGLFTLLVLTGFPLKFADQLWAAWTVSAFGGIRVVRLLHHWAGIALTVGVAWHLLRETVAAVRRAWGPGPDGKPVGLVQSIFALPMVITPSDARRALQLVKHLLGMRVPRPTFGRFTITEKFEYFGVIWGTVLLGLTGLMLWGEQFASHLFGGRAFTLATIIHTYEAFLALIHVGILHIYNAVFSPAVFPLSMATISGTTPKAKLAEENGLFVEEVATELGISSEPNHG